MRTIDTRKKSITFKIAIVASRFNENVTTRLVDGALARLKECGFSDDQITLAWVPGAIEIPVVAQRLAQQSTYEAIIAIGSVIRGETDHYDYVCSQVSHGCQHVALQNDLPVLFGVLTTDTEEQAMNRAGAGASGHKGVESVDAAIEVVACLRELG